MKRAILIGVAYAKNTEIEKDMIELAQLVRSVGVDPVEKFWQILRSHSPTYMGKGKLEQVKRYIALYDVDGIVADDELTPSQRKKLAGTLGVEVLDRTQIILRAFAASAATSEGKTEVELATLEYEMSHLRGSRDYLSRTGGGIGTSGPGESKLEMDRRAIRKKINVLRSRLEKFSRERAVKKSRRLSSIVPKVSIVGYTNSGKSMLLRNLSGFSVKSENRLFTTLDPVTKKIWLGPNISALFSDTVGFISKLPHQLVKAFRSTLEEIVDADLILLMADGSDERMEEKLRISQEVMKELGVSGIPVVKVINKIDLCDRARLEDLSTIHRDAVLISATKGLYTDELLERIAEELTAGYKEADHVFSDSQWAEISKMNGIRIVKSEEKDGCIRAVLKINPSVMKKFAEVFYVLP